MSSTNTGIRVCVVAACALVAAGGWCAQAQTQGTEQHAAADRAHAPTVTETIFLKNATGQYDMNDIQTALRNNFPWSKIYGVAGQYAITVTDTAEDMEGIKKMVAELDRPKKIYRVTYSVSDMENGKRTGTQHYSMVVASGSKGMLKKGKRVPIITGATSETAAQTSQVQYIDVGVNIESSIDGQGLKTKFEMSGVADEKSGTGVQDPVIEQTMLENTSAVGVGKAIVLGSLAVPGTSRQEEIEVTTELLGQ